MSFVKQLKQDEDFVSMPKGAAEKEIIEAEEELGLSFSKEFISYTKEFGCASADGHVFLGVVRHKRLSVVEQTILAREEIPALPLSFYAVEISGDDGIVVFQDKDGKVYGASAQHKITKLADSLEEYLLDY